MRISLSEMKEDVKLISGLTGIVEIKTGKRNVLNYFLEPLTEAFRHSMKEK